MLKEERLQLILERLSHDQKVYFGGLSELLDVSEDTVRRDIKELADRGLLKSVRGGAVPHSRGPSHFRDRMKYDSAQKQIIAEKAVKLIQNGQLVIFDGGTSTMMVAELLPRDIHLTVVTNSFPVASILENYDHIEVLFAGGRLAKSSFVTTGIDTVCFLKKFRADLCLMGICSIHAELGVTGPEYEESEVKRTMIERSQEIIALATVEKLGTAESHYICPTDRLAKIVTDQSAEIQDFSIYQNQGVQIL